MNEPKLRFKADDGSEFPDWEEKKLNEIAVRVTRKNKDNVTDIPLTISSADGLIDQRNFFNKVVASKDMSGYYLLKNGEFAYNKSYSKGYDFGSIKRLDLYDEGALSTLYICFALNKNENSDFYQKYFDSLSWYPELQKICAEGARNHGLLNVPTNDFFQLKLCVPSSDKEQQKIAEFLSTIDTVIKKQKETVSAWEERKKGVMQKLFSQEVRFKADDGSDYPDWEEKKLKNILKEYKEYSAKDGSYEHVSLTKEGVVPKSERYERDFLVKDVDKKYRITHLGDICYNPANLKFGVICRNKYGDGIFSPIYVTFRVCKDMLPEFVEMLVTRRDFIEYALKYQQGTVYERMSVSPDDLLSIRVMVPCMAEQKKIADCLVSLDNVINSYKATLSAWEELKKGLLQQMFV